MEGQKYRGRASLRGRCWAHSMDVSAEPRRADHDRQPCVVLTGAGVSTESGIPDFRSPTGIWAEVDPMEYASLRAFREDPEKVWSFYAKRVDMLTGAEPNEGIARSRSSSAAAS